jgi:hypothetical protein
MDIGYLERIREDLLDAALRETAGHRRARRPRSPRALLAAGTAGVLLAAATLGWFVTRGDVIGRGGAAAGSAAQDRFIVRSPFATAPAPMEGYAEVPTEQARGGSAPRGSASIPLGDLTKVIRTASLTVSVPQGTFQERFAQAQDVAARYGGIVQASSGREGSGSIVMRVPASRLQAALHDLRALGQVEVQSERGQDVTADYVDLRARLRIAKARRTVLLGLMARATTIEQTIRVQNALDDTQLRIEELQGALTLLEDRVAFATIRLELHEEGVTPESEIRNPSIPRAFERAIAGFFGVVAGTIVGLGYLVPILVLAAVVWFVVRRIRRRRAA